MVVFYSPVKKSAPQQKAITLHIDTIDAFGQGVAHYHGKTIFVKNALPSEEVDVRLTEDKKQYAKAKVLKYRTKSEQRVEHICPHYHVCGGCEMQHMPSSMQHTVKAQALSDHLKKETGYAIAVNDINIIAAKPYHYRRRARLAIMCDKNHLVIGFRQLESNHIVDINACPVLVTALADLIQPLKTCLYGIKDKKALGHIELIDVDSGTICVLRHIRPLSEQDRLRLHKFALHHKISLYLYGDELMHFAGLSEHYYCVNQLKLTFSPLDFIQVNRDINLKMIEQAIDWLDVRADDRILDLFCGMGNFSLPLATLCQQVIGVEGVNALVEKAQYNVTSNRQQLTAQVEFFVSNLEETENNMTWFVPGINKVLLDPARAGAYQVIDKLIAHAPSHIVYISCNPATLIRDSLKLLQAGYRITNASILDMFPQTKHIESMLLFTNLGIKENGINTRSTPTY
ncbi:23S rRNA (uracil1939-C5)-methyltransferase [Orbus hercynius]|uniref:23S rRNA (uracil(1939)-C(5))-methyltransferase RlmD n=1 Tax=Orbus hercynius TaxID=593135 RepID=A0A495REZ7_9GAMM|nr:23S rRNA (uracil(1939)-C(5))-methyltransferase RlmD [Orbus hercynius]RKS85955.1 23S rRNA (uracil1939-C5)-methyltransferase [Orbus hercynius]